MSEGRVEVREEADEVVTCDRCGRPFAREDYLALHRGLDHEGDLTADERAAYEAALADEEASLRKFRLLAVLALVFVYFGFLMLWALVNLLL